MDLKTILYLLSIDRSDNILTRKELISELGILEDRNDQKKKVEGQNQTLQEGEFLKIHQELDEEKTAQVNV